MLEVPLYYDKDAHTCTSGKIGAVVNKLEKICGLKTWNMKGIFKSGTVSLHCSLVTSL